MSRRDDVDVVDSVLESASEGHEYIMDCGPHGEVEYEMHEVSRRRRQQFIDTLPDELVEFMQEQADEVRDESDVEDLSNLEDVQDAAPEDAPKDAMIGPEVIDEMEDLIAESFDHPNITESETRQLMELWPDDMFYSTTFLIVAISGEAQGVEGFRTERQGAESAR